MLLILRLSNTFKNAITFKRIDWACINIINTNVCYGMFDWPSNKNGKKGDFYT